MTREASFQVEVAIVCPDLPARFYLTWKKGFGYKFYKCGSGLDMIWLPGFKSGPDPEMEIRTTVPFYPLKF